MFRGSNSGTARYGPGIDFASEPVVAKSTEATPMKRQRLRALSAEFLYGSDNNRVIATRVQVRYAALNACEGAYYLRWCRTAPPSHINVEF